METITPNTQANQYSVGQDKLYLSWEEYGALLRTLALKIPVGEFSSVYGLPRGGLNTAVFLSHFLDIPLLMSVAEITEDTLIVDDLADTGTQTARFVDYKRAVIFCKPWALPRPHYWVASTTDWVVFPYETTRIIHRHDTAERIVKANTNQKEGEYAGLNMGILTPSAPPRERLGK